MLLPCLYYVTSLRPRCLVEGPDRLDHRILVLPEHLILFCHVPTYFCLY